MSNIFTGKWICDPRFSDLQPRNMYHREAERKQHRYDHPKELLNLHTLFRKEFTLSKKPGRYLLRIASDDYGKIKINGSFVGQGPTTGYLDACHYNVFDITDKLHDGVNVIENHVYYQGHTNHVWFSGDLRMGMIADLIAPDGSVLLCTDESWEYAPILNFVDDRMVGYETQYLENYDSRIPAQPFSPVGILKNNDVVFYPDPTPVLDIYTKLPETIEAIPNGFFYDFGTEVVGTLKIRATGESGARIRILCGEELEDTPVKVRHNMRCYCNYDEIWTLAGGSEELEQYDYKAFRYVAVLVDGGDAKIGGVAVTVRHAPFNDAACTIQADDKILEAVFNICKNGVKWGTQEVYVDCPQREKGQYAGDMTVTSGSQLWLTGDIYMLEKGIRAQAHSAKIDDGLMAVMSGGLMQEIADYSLQFPLLLERHYAYTGNRAFLEEMLPINDGMLAHFAAFAREDGLLSGVSDKWNLVDWPENLRDGYDFPLPRPVGPGTHNVLNAFYIGAVIRTEQLKEQLGSPYEKKSDKLLAAFNKAFFRPDLGLYVDCEDSNHASLHSNMLAPFYGFTPAGYEQSIGDFLVSKVADGIICGVYMSYFLLRGLCKLGRYDDVYSIITSQAENSWYNMVREGGTTCFEAWGKDKKGNTSLCHPWASTPIVVLIEELMGVSLDGTVGEHHIPASAGRVQMTIPTCKGFVKVDTANR